MDEPLDSRRRSPRQLPGTLAPRRDLIGFVWFAGGATWMIAAIFGAGAADKSSRFYVAELIWLAAQLLLLAGLMGLRVLRPDDGRKVGRIGFATAIAGRVVFVVAEVVALISGSESEAVLPVGAILTAIGMIMVGEATLRANQWTGWSSLTPLAVGVYPFIFMFPLVALDAGPEIGVAFWALPALAVGLAVMRLPEPTSADAATTASPRSPASPSLS